MTGNIEAFESCRSALLALAYRMLGEIGRAEDIVQEAWIRWQEREVEVAAPKSYLLRVVARLCLDDLGAAHNRREQSRSDQLPEPVDLSSGAAGQLELLDEVSMAFLVLLQRLTPAERAVFLLHDIFDFDYSEIGSLVSKSQEACRQLLHRARDNVAAARRTLSVSREEHGRLLQVFLHAAVVGNVEEMTRLLADDAILMADGGPEGTRFGRVRNLPRPVYGGKKIAALFAAAASQDLDGIGTHTRDLNGQPAIVATREGRVVAAILISVADGKIQQLFIQGDPARLRHVGKSVN